MFPQKDYTIDYHLLSRNEIHLFLQLSIYNNPPRSHPTYHATDSIARIISFTYFCKIIAVSSSFSKYEYFLICLKVSFKAFSSSLLKYLRNMCNS